jgi:hypothetical protein
LASDQNISQAQFAYGLCLINGKAVAVDFLRSAKYLKLAFDQGFAEPGNRYSCCLEFGRGLRSSLARADEVYRWLAMHTSSTMNTAMNNCSRCFEFGIGSPKDLSLAQSGRTTRRPDLTIHRVGPPWVSALSTGSAFLWIYFFPFSAASRPWKLVRVAAAFTCSLTPVWRECRRAQSKATFHPN